MAEKQTLAQFRDPTEYDLARTLADAIDDGRITPKQFLALKMALAGFLPHADMHLTQRTPRGVVYASVRTPDDLFALTVSARGAIQYS